MSCQCSSSAYQKRRSPARLYSPASGVIAAWPLLLTPTSAGVLHRELQPVARGYTSVSRSQVQITGRPSRRGPPPHNECPDKVSVTLPSLSIADSQTFITICLQSNRDSILNSVNKYEHCTARKMIAWGWLQVIQYDRNSEGLHAFYTYT